uniref:Uncharacterized protein n=1 Tax=Heterorhabditis bacteriophora TaxID=37862 RepID=A0A1I7W773_HETBA
MAKLQYHGFLLCPMIYGIRKNVYLIS